MTSANEKIILVFTDWYLPGYKAGGPIRSLVNLVNAVPYTFYIVTGNKDHHCQEKYDGVLFDTWMKTGHRIHVQYLSDENINQGNFRAIIQEVQPDFVYLNSLFSVSFTLMPMRVLRSMKQPPKCVVAPRGMLKPGALSVKGFKKKWFLRIARLFRWYDAVIWHATNREEIAEIQLTFGKDSFIRLSPNLSAPIPSVQQRPEKLRGELRLVSIARISPEKGILEAIRFLKNAGLEGKVTCDFIGTMQNEMYLEECKKAANEAPDMAISFTGEIHPDQIPSTLRKYHFFYLATWGENFGHAIAEALYSGLPVIISDKTPWQGLEQRDAGWVIPMEHKAFANVLKRAMEMDHKEYLVWSEAAQHFAKESIEKPETTQAAIELFKD